MTESGDLSRLSICTYTWVCHLSCKYDSDADKWYENDYPVELSNWWTKEIIKRQVDWLFKIFTI